MIQDHLLEKLERTIPICADESCHDVESLENLVGLYDFINIKLDKAGGLTEAVNLLNTAKKNGFKMDFFQNFLLFQFFYKLCYILISNDH